MNSKEKCAIPNIKKNCTDDCSNCSFKLPEPFTAEIGENSVIGRYYLNEELMRNIRKMADVEAVKYAMRILKVWCKNKDGIDGACSKCPMCDACNWDREPRDWEID